LGNLAVWDQKVAPAAKEEGIDGIGPHECFDDNGLVVFAAALVALVLGYLDVVALGHLLTGDDLVVDLAVDGADLLVVNTLVALGVEGVEADSSTTAGGVVHLY
jgi:hypothetical protein